MFEKKDKFLENFNDLSLEEIKKYLKELLYEVKKSNKYNISVEKNIEDIERKIDFSDNKKELQEVFYIIEQLREKEAVEAITNTKEDLGILKDSLKRKLLKKDNTLLIQSKAEKGRDLAQKRVYDLLRDSFSFYDKVPVFGNMIKKVLKKAF